MSTNETQNEQADRASADSSSPWSGQAREAWVSQAIAAATASLREAGTPCDQRLEGRSDID